MRTAKELSDLLSEWSKKVDPEHHSRIEAKALILDEAAELLWEYADLREEI